VVVANKVTMEEDKGMQLNAYKVTLNDKRHENSENKYKTLYLAGSTCVLEYSII